MKIGRLGVNISILYITKGDKERRKTFPPLDLYPSRFDVPYIDDGKDLHKFDVYYADKTKENYKNVCIIDIHGGSYLFGWRKNNYTFALEFLDRGYDFIAIDYIPIKHGRGINNLVEDCASCLAYISSHRKELDIENDRIVITGDSAGGHLALTMQEVNDDSSYEKLLGLDLKGFHSEAVLINCPVFDLMDASSNETMKRSGKRRMFGPRFDDDDFMKLYCPKTHFSSLHSPIFVSTCHKDFIRTHSEKAFVSLAERDDLQSETMDLTDESIEHVHNVIYPKHPSSVKVNEAMDAFIQKVLGLTK